MSTQAPMLAKTVLYKLSQGDVAAILQTVKRISSSATLNLNTPQAGDVYPALVVRDFGGCVNLKVSLDGGPGAEYWATSRTEGTDEGHWAWSE